VAGDGPRFGASPSLAEPARGVDAVPVVENEQLRRRAERAEAELDTAAQATSGLIGTHGEAK